MGAAGPWGPEDGSIALLPRKMSQSSGFLCVPTPCCLHFLKMGRSVKRRALTLLMLLRRRKRHLEKGQGLCFGSLVHTTLLAGAYL